MRKSKIYREAAVSVINAGHLTMHDKLEILEVLLSDRHLAEYKESRERKSRMFRCNECGEEFDAPEYYIEYHGDASAPGERWRYARAAGYGL